MTLAYRGHPLDPPPSQTAHRLIQLYNDRKRLSEIGYTYDALSESTLLTEAIQVIESQVDRLKASDRKREATKSHG